MTAEPSYQSPSSVGPTATDAKAQTFDSALRPIRKRVGWLVFFTVLNVLASLGWLRGMFDHEQWEYRTDFIRDSDSLSGSMNALGAQGWEAYSVRRATDGNATSETSRWGTEVMYRRRH